MSVRIIAQLNPFTTDREEFQFSEGMTLQEILDTLNIDTKQQQVFIGVNDKINISPEYIIKTGDIINIKVVPLGDNWAEYTAGGIAIGMGVVGLLLGPAGWAATAVAWGAIGAGSYVIGNAAVEDIQNYMAEMTNMGDSYTSPKTSSPSYLRGGANIIGKSQPVPLILGRHRYYPMQASVPKVTYLGQDYDNGVIGSITWEIEKEGVPKKIPTELRDIRMNVFTQQLDQVYLLGHKEVKPIEETTKRGDSPISTIKSTEVGYNSTTLYGDKAAKYINVGKRLDAYDADGYTTVETVLQSGTTSVEFNLQLVSSYCTYQKDSGTEPVQKEVISLVLVELTNKTTGAVEYDTSLKLFGGAGTKSDPTKPVSFTGTIPHTLDPDSVYSLSITRGDDRVDDSASPLYRGDNYKQTANLLYNSVTCYTDKDVLSANAKSAYSYMSLRVTDKEKTKEITGEINDVNLIVQTHIPVYSGVGSGPTAWTTVEASSNPAALFLYVLQGSPNARPVADEDIDWESLETWYTFCENNSLECNAVLEKPGAVLSVLKMLALCGRASFYLTEKYGVLIEDIKPFPTLLLTDKNTIGISTQRNVSPSVHGYVCTIVNKENDLYVSNELEQRIYRSGYNADGSNGKKEAKYMEHFSIPGVTDANQMYALARFFLNVAERRNQTVTTTMDWEHVLATTGDLVNASFDELLYGIARGRLKEVIKNVSDQIVSVKLDEKVTLEAGKDYGITVRYATGHQMTFPVNNTEEATQTLTLTTPTIVDLEPNDLYAFGVVNKITGQYIIASITPAEELRAQLTLVPYAPEIYTIGDLPTYTSNITIPSLNRDIGLITEPFTPTELSQQISSNISSVDSLLNSSTKYAVKTGVPIANYLRDDVLELKLSLNYLYYTSKEDLKLYRVGTVNAEEASTLVIDKEIKMFDVDEDDSVIVYSDIDADNTIWKYDIQGNVHTQLTTATGSNPLLSGDSVLYINYDEGNTIYSTTLGSVGNGSVYVNHPTSNMSVFNGNLFYVDSSTGYLVSRGKEITDPSLKGDLFSTTAVNSIIATSPMIWSNTKVSSVPMYVDVASNISFVNKEAFYGDVIKHDMNSQGDYAFVDSSGDLFYVSLFDERTQARLEAETDTETDTFTGNIVNGDYRITGLSGADLTKIVVNDSISGAGIQGNTRVTYKGNGYITLNYPAGESATGRTFTVFGTRLVLSANRVIIPGTVTAGLLETNAMSSIAVVPDDALVEENRGKPLFSHNHLTGVEERYDETGKLLFQFAPDTGLSLSDGISIGGTIVPVDPALTDTVVTKTSELTDDAGLGETAVWDNVSGTGKPEDNATNTPKTYIQGTIPTITRKGETWLCTADVNDGTNYYINGSVYISNATSGTVWNKYANESFIQAIPPVARRIKDQWKCTANYPPTGTPTYRKDSTYIWDGAEWDILGDSTEWFMNTGGDIDRNGKFQVDSNGVLTCADAIIGGTLAVGTKTADVTTGVPGFKVESDGSITANNITANNGTFSGTILGAAISGSNIQSENTAQTELIQLSDGIISFGEGDGTGTYTSVGTIKGRKAVIIPGILELGVLDLTGSIYMSGGQQCIIDHNKFTVNGTSDFNDDVDITGFLTTTKAIISDSYVQGKGGHVVEVKASNSSGFITNAVLYDAIAPYVGGTLGNKSISGWIYSPPTGYWYACLIIYVSATQFDIKYSGAGGFTVTKDATNNTPIQYMLF